MSTTRAIELAVDDVGIAIDGLCDRITAHPMDEDDDSAIKDACDAMVALRRLLHIKTKVKS